MKRKKAERAVWSLMDGGLDKLDRETLGVLLRACLGAESSYRCPGTWSYYLTVHSDGRSWSLGEKWEASKPREPA